MAVDQDPQENQGTADAAPETSTPPEPIPAAEVDSPEQGDEDAIASSSETAAPAVESAKAPEWDPDRQRRDEEKARERQRKDEERIAKIVDQKVAQVLAERTASPVQQQAVDELAKIESMVEECDKIEAEAEQLLENADLQAAAAKQKAARDKRKQIEKARNAIVRKLDERQRAREAQESQTASERAALQRYFEAHPAIDPEKFIQARDAAIQQAADEGFTGEGITTRMRILVNEQIKANALNKKSNSPASRSTPAKTATTASGSAPAVTQVIPANSGARKSATQMADLEAKFAAHFRKPTR